MPNFLMAIDEMFNATMSKKTITKKDLISLKTFIIDAYEKDGIIDLIEINNSMKIISVDLCEFDN